MERHTPNRKARPLSRRFDGLRDNPSTDMRFKLEAEEPNFCDYPDEMLARLLLRLAAESFAEFYEDRQIIADLTYYQAGYWYGQWTGKRNVSQIAKVLDIKPTEYIEAISRAKVIAIRDDEGLNLKANERFLKRLHEERTLQSGKSLPEDQKAAIIKLFFENKRKYYRQYEDEKQAEAATYYWTAWEIIEKLELNAPIARLALSLGEEAIRVYEIVTAHVNTSIVFPKKKSAAKLF